MIRNILLASRGLPLKTGTALLLLGGGLIQLAFSQPPAVDRGRGFELVQPPLPEAACEPLVGGFAPHLPPVPSKTAPPELRGRAASSFIESLSKNDAMFEVILGQGRLLVLKEDLVRDELKIDDSKGDGNNGAANENRNGERNTNGAPRLPRQAMIAVGNPDIVDYEVLDPRHIRLLGKNIGVTDLAVTTVNGQTYSYEVHVVYDLRLLEARICQLFPDADVHVAQLGENVVVEGEARDTAEIARIMQVIKLGIFGEGPPAAAGPVAGPAQPASPLAALIPTATPAEEGPDIINLLRVPGPQQVMLRVQIAELNRTAIRQIGSDLLFADGQGRIVGTKLNSITTGSSTADGAGLLGTAATTVVSASPTTALAVFEKAGFQMMFSALRQNSLLKILAEPNLVAMNGHQARFLAGGEFPVPVPQSGAGGGPATITVQFKKFGVQLAFVPYILDGDTIRLSVDPEVSSIDFSLGIELSGTRVPGLNTRNAHTVVEMREGQTLAIAGLLQLSMSNQTLRIPGLGDLPYIGPFFSNYTGNDIEKELLVLVTPHLIEPLNPHEKFPRPGDEVYAPNDLEFYLLGRLEGRTGHSEFRAATVVDNPIRRMYLERQNINGPMGFSE